MINVINALSRRNQNMPLKGTVAKRDYCRSSSVSAAAKFSVAAAESAAMIVKVYWWCGRYDVVSQLPTSLSEVSVESSSLPRLMSGVKQLHVTGYLTSLDTRRQLATDLLHFVFQVLLCDDALYKLMFYLLTYLLTY